MEASKNVSTFWCGKAMIGGAYGIRTRDLRLERAVSLATRRMRHTKNWGSWIRTRVYRFRVCRPTARRIPSAPQF